MFQRWIACFQSRPRTVLAVCALLLAVQVGPWWYSSVDSTGYLSMARSMAHGDGPKNLGSPLLWYSPGYSVLISPLFLLSDRPFWSIGLLQWLLAVALLLGVYRWAQRVVPEGAIWLAALTVVNHGFWVHFRRPLSEVAFMCAVMWAINALDETRGAKRGPRWAFCLVGGAVLVALACSIRPVGIMLAPAFAIWALNEVRGGWMTWWRSAAASAIVGVSAAMPVGLFVMHERMLADELGGRSYIDEFEEAASSPIISYSRGVQLCVSDVGRVCLPGLFKSHGRPGDWTDPNMLVHLPYFALVSLGWWRWRQGANDLFAWFMPFYLLLIAAHAIDTGARLLLPLLPGLFVCAWFGLASRRERRQAIAALCLALQILVGGGYWLGIDLPRALHQDRQWPLVDELARQMNENATAAPDALPGDLRLMLELALDRPVTQRR